MRIERPDPDSLPVVYDDEGHVLSNPNDPSTEWTPEGVEPTPQAPPLTGRGSGVDAWRDFARHHELAGADDLPKPELVAQLRALGAIPGGPAIDDDDDTGGGG